MQVFNQLMERKFFKPKIDTFGMTKKKSIFSVKGKKSQSLSIVNVHVANIQPKENVVYTKQTQTTSTGTHHERDGKH
jgi:hypothetical protein